MLMRIAHADTVLLDLLTPLLRDHQSLVNECWGREAEVVVQLFHVLSLKRVEFYLQR